MNQVTQALSSGEHVRTPNSPDSLSPDVARFNELTAADHNLDNWRNTFDPAPIAAAAMSGQVESHPHATTVDRQQAVDKAFEDIMAAAATSGTFEPGYIGAISGGQLGADMPADTPRPAPVEAQNFQQYQGV